MHKDTEIWWKILREIDLLFLWWILTRALESLKNVYFNGFFFRPKYLIFDRKKCRRVSFMTLKIDVKFEE